MPALESVSSRSFAQMNTWLVLRMYLASGRTEAVKLKSPGSSLPNLAAMLPNDELKDGGLFGAAIFPVDRELRCPMLVADPPSEVPQLTEAHGRPTEGVAAGGAGSVVSLPLSCPKEPCGSIRDRTALGEGFSLGAVPATSQRTSAAAQTAPPNNNKVTYLVSDLQRCWLHCWLSFAQIWRVQLALKLALEQAPRLFVNY